MSAASIDWINGIDGTRTNLRPWSHREPGFTKLSRLAPSLFQPADQWTLENALLAQSRVAESELPDWHAIEILDSFCEFSDYFAVRNFLAANAHVIPLLFEACEEIGKCFGSAARIVLTAERDPDSDDAVTLYALASTRLSPKDANEALERLDAEWWLDAMPRARSRLMIDVEYPR